MELRKYSSLSGPTPKNSSLACTKFLAATLITEKMSRRASRERFKRNFKWTSRLEIRLQPSLRSEEHTSELQSLMRISYAVFCLKKKNNEHQNTTYNKSLITQK